VPASTYPVVRKQGETEEQHTGYTFRGKVMTSMLAIPGQHILLSSILREIWGDCNSTFFLPEQVFF
jgi:hypothetical protein